MNKIALGIFAHPDDAEMMAAGTLARLSKAGWEIHIATMTPGDKGSAELSREEISRIRRMEATRAASLLGASYHCLEMEDIYFNYNKESINTTTALIRRIMPGIVLTASPVDYMVDHEMASLIVQTACFCAGIKNMEIDEPILEEVPALYYADPMEGIDKLGHPIEPGFYVDVTAEMELKERMLAAHESQRNWLLIHHRMDEYIEAMKRFSAQRGKETGVAFAEGFRQHLGHGYPKENRLRMVMEGSKMG